MNYLQKNRKYGAVVSMMTTATWSSNSVRHKNRSNGTNIIRQHENKNITREGAVLCKKIAHTDTNDSQRCT